MHRNENILNIPISSIVEITELPDRELNAAHVASLVATNEPDEWPPVVLTDYQGQYGRITGKHRIEAAKQLQLTTIKAVVRSYNGSIYHMYCDMWEDNTKNGLPLTTKEKKEYAVTLYHGEGDTLSLREIGRRAGLPHQTVKAAIKADSKDEDEQDTEQRTYNQGVQDYTKRLVTALNNFFTNELALFGSPDGKRSETKRAKALAATMNASDRNVTLMQSLARTFNETASILEDKAAE